MVFLHFSFINTYVVLVSKFQQIEFLDQFLKANSRIIDVQVAVSLTNPYCSNVEVGWGWIKMRKIFMKNLYIYTKRHTVLLLMITCPRLTSRT